MLINVLLCLIKVDNLHLYYNVNINLAEYYTAPVTKTPDAPLKQSGNQLYMRHGAQYKSEYG